MPSQRALRFLYAAMLPLVLLAGFTGCQPSPAPKPKPKPPVVVVPPAPDVVTTGKQVLVIHSADPAAATPELARLKVGLQAGPHSGWFAANGYHVEVLPDSRIHHDGKPHKLVERWRPEFSKLTLPALLVVGVNGRLTYKESLTSTATPESVKAAIAANGEPEFAAQDFVDVDFAAQPEYIKGDTTDEPRFGQGFLDGEQLGNANLGEPVFEAQVPVIPREEWDRLIEAIDREEAGLDSLVTRIYNQGREGSCTSNATAQSTEIIEFLLGGRDAVVQKSAISLYKQVGRSPMSGSSVSGNLQALRTVGLLPVDNAKNKARFKHTMSATGFYQAFPSGWEETAKRFRGHEYLEIRSFDGFITALLRGYPVVYGRSGHAICGVRPVKRNGELYVKYANSWGDWGDKGFGYDSERMVRSGATWAFAMRSMVDPEAAASLKSRPAIEERDSEPSFGLAP